LERSVSTTKFWLIILAFLAGTFITPVFLILTTGDDEAALPPLSASPRLEALAISTPEAPVPSPTVQSSPGVTPSPTTQAAAATSTPTRPSPSATPEAPATPTPPAPAGLPSLSGRFRIVDTITTGTGAGTVVSFEVDLQQTGAAVTGGNGELNLSGRIEGGMLRAQFTQPALGYSGTFTWQLDPSGGTGEFVASVPNGGSSRLQRL